MKESCNTTQDVFEESLLQAADSVSEQAKDLTTKMIVDLFKSAILKKYKDAFDQELEQSTVHRKNIDKAVDFCYSDICFSIRRLPNISDEEKECLIKEGKQIKNRVKEFVERILVDRGYEILS